MKERQEIQNPGSEEMEILSEGVSCDDAIHQSGLGKDTCGY